MSTCQIVILSLIFTQLNIFTSSDVTLGCICRIPRLIRFEQIGMKQIQFLFPFPFPFLPPSIFKSFKKVETLSMKVLQCHGLGISMEITIYFSSDFCCHTMLSFQFIQKMHNLYKNDFLRRLWNVGIFSLNAQKRLQNICNLFHLFIFVRVTRKIWIWTSNNCYTNAGHMFDYFIVNRWFEILNAKQFLQYLFSYICAQVRMKSLTCSRRVMKLWNSSSVQFLNSFFLLQNRLKF